MITTGSSIIIGATLISLSIFYSKKDVFRKVQIWNWKFISTILIFFLIISAIDDNWSFFTISLIALLVTIIRIVFIKTSSFIAKRKVGNNEYQQLIRAILGKAERPLTQEKEGSILLKFNPYYNQYKAEFNFFAESFSNSFSGDFQNPEIYLNGNIVIRYLNWEYSWFIVREYSIVRTKVNIIIIKENKDDAKNRILGSMYVKSEASSIEEASINEDEKVIVEMHLHITEEDYNNLVKALEHNKLSNRNSAIKFRIIFPEKYNDSEKEKYIEKIVKGGSICLFEDCSFNISHLWISSFLDLNKE